MNDTRSDKNVPDLLAAFIKLLQSHRGIFGQQRVYERAAALALAEVFSFGRHTVTQLLLALGLEQADWSAWYRLYSHSRFDEAAAAEVMLQAVLAELPEEEVFITGFDGFHVPRCSRKMPGTGWAKAGGTAPFKPGIARAQRFVEGSWLTPLADGYSRAIPLRCLAAFPPKAVPSSAPARKEWEAALRYLDWLRTTLDRLARQRQAILALADGSFDTVGMWAELPERVSLLVRTRRDRCLYCLPEAYAGRGRPTLYGEKAPAPYEWLHDRKGFQRYEVVVRGKRRSMRCRVEGPFLRETLPQQVLFLIVVGGGKRPTGSRRKTYNPCFYLVSAVERDGRWQLPVPLKQLLPWLWQRWELEVAHRELKSGLGLGEKQCWNRVAAVVSVQWSAWLYGTLLLAGYRTWGLLGGPQPPGRWRKQSRRWSLNTLWRGYRAALWGYHDFRASCLPSLDDWLKKQHFVAELHNAVTASARA